MSTNQLAMFSVAVNPQHPAKYTDVFLPIFAQMLIGARRILDPFGGTGKVFLLNLWLPEADIQAVEIEPEWAAINPRTTLGNALALPWDDGWFDAVCTSPTYGNRMADTLRDQYDRITYTSKIGRTLHEENSGSLQWGDKYRDFHERAWREVRRVLSPGGRFVLNIKDHIRSGEIQRVTDWHIETLCGLGFSVVEHVQVETPSMRWGQNGDARVKSESVVLFACAKAT